VIGDNETRVSSIRGKQSMFATKITFTDANANASEATIFEK
jgi:hypothetical protein